MSSTPDGPASSLSFEAAYAELQQVVQQLEDGGLSLDEALQRFDRGSQLVQRCHELLAQAELRLTRLPPSPPPRPPSRARGSKGGRALLDGAPWVSCSATTC